MQHATCNMQVHEIKMHPDGMRYGECLTFLLPECEGWLEKRSSTVLRMRSSPAPTSHDPPRPAPPRSALPCRPDMIRHD